MFVCFKREKDYEFQYIQIGTHLNLTSFVFQANNHVVGIS